MSWGEWGVPRCAQSGGRNVSTNAIENLMVESRGAAEARERASGSAGRGGVGRGAIKHYPMILGSEAMQEDMAAKHGTQQLEGSDEWLKRQ